MCCPATTVVQLARVTVVASVVVMAAASVVAFRVVWATLRVAVSSMARVIASDRQIVNSLVMMRALLRVFCLRGWGVSRRLSPGCGLQPPSLRRDAAPQRLPAEIGHPEDDVDPRQPLARPRLEVADEPHGQPGLLIAD